MKKLVKLTLLTLCLALTSTAFANSPDTQITGKFLSGCKKADKIYSSLNDMQIRFNESSKDETALKETCQVLQKDKSLKKAQSYTQNRAYGRFYSTESVCVSGAWVRQCYGTYPRYPNHYPRRDCYLTYVCTAYTTIEHKADGFEQALLASSEIANAKQMSKGACEALNSSNISKAQDLMAQAEETINDMLANDFTYFASRMNCQVTE